MKRISALALLLLFCPVLALAQFTTVSGTVTDPNGLPYAFGAITPSLISAGTPIFTATGQPYSPPSQSVGLDINGSFVMQLADNTALTPGGTQWNFQVCSNGGSIQPSGGKGPVCFSLAAPITISGSTQSITAQLDAVALALSFNPGSGTLTGGGTITFFAKWSGASALGNGPLSDNGTTVSSTEPISTPSVTLSGAGALSLTGPGCGTLPTLSAGSGGFGLAAGCVPSINTNGGGWVAIPSSVTSPIVLTAGVLSCPSCNTGGSGVWSGLTSAGANLTLSNAGFSSTFNQTSAAPWTWANTTAATSLVDQNSPILNLAGNVWNGSASITVPWAIQNIETGTTPAADTSTLTFTQTGGHSGSVAFVANDSFLNVNFANVFGTLLNIELAGNPITFQAASLGASLTGVPGTASNVPGAAFGSFAVPISFAASSGSTNAIGAGSYTNVDQTGSASGNFTGFVDSATAGGGFANFLGTTFLIHDFQDDNGSVFQVGKTGAIFPTGGGSNGTLTDNTGSLGTASQVLTSGIGSAVLWSTSVPIDASKFTSGYTAGHEDVLLANAIAAIPGNAQSGTGGYGIINLMNLPQSSVFSTYPFAAIVSNGTTNFTGVQKCGEIWVSGGQTIAINGPMPLPACWFWRVKGKRATAKTLIASTSFPAVYNTGTITNSAATLVAGGTAQYQLTVTGTGTHFATGCSGGPCVQPYELIMVCGTAGNNGPACQGNGTTTCGTLCGNQIYGMVLAVNSDTSLTVGTNDTSAAGHHGQANASQVNFVIKGDLFPAGTFNQTGSDVGGSFSGIEGGTYSCGNQSGCNAVFANYSMQENFTLSQVTAADWPNSAVDFEGLVYNGGPFTGLILNEPTSCTHTTVALILRAPGGAPHEFDDVTFSLDRANCADLGADIEGGPGTKITNIHAEDNQANSNPNTFISIGQNAGAVPITTCPIACPEVTNFSGGVSIDTVTIPGNYTNGIVIGSGNPAGTTSVSLANLQFAGVTNTLVDNLRGCTIIGTGGDGYLTRYERQGTGPNFIGTAQAAINACGSSRPQGVTLAAAMSAQTSTAQHPLSTGRKGTDAVTNGTTTLTSATAAFTQGDVNSWFVCVACGAAGADLITQIASVQSGTSVTLSTAATSSASGQSWYFGISFPLLASKYYKLRCEIPVTFAATATIAFGFTGTSNPSSYDLSFSGNTGAAGVPQFVDFLGQTTWVSGSTNSGASGAPGAAARRIHLEASIINSANIQTITLGTVANGTNSITVSGRTDCEMRQMN